MTIVKRYPNRKLYNKNAKQYVTLDGIAALIRDGEEVQILDHTTGEDLTAITLTQIILEKEKREGGFLPRSVLTSLVRSGGETLVVLRSTLASSLGMTNQVDLEIERRINELIAVGELDELDGLHLRDKLLSFTRVNKQQIIPSEKKIQWNLRKLGIPTHQDLKTIEDQLEKLTAQLEEIAPELSPLPGS